MKSIVIRNDSNEWLVVDENTDEVLSRHDTEEDALHQQNILLSNQSQITNPPLEDSSNDPRLRNFNWGAFLLNWIWALSYKQYVYAIIIIVLSSIGEIIRISNNHNLWFRFSADIVCIYISIFILGRKGNIIAWKTYGDQFGTVDNMLAAQKRWAHWGYGLLILALVIVIIAIIIGVLSFQNAASGQ